MTERARPDTATIRTERAAERMTVIAARTASDADRDGNKVVDLIEAARWATARDAFKALGATIEVRPPVVAATQPASPPAGAPQPTMPPPQPSGVAAAPPSRTLAPASPAPVGGVLEFDVGALGFALAEEEYLDSVCYPMPASGTALCGGPDTLSPNGGSPPYHFQLGSGVGFPPQGIRLELNGRLSGRPSAATAGRSHTFEVCAVDLRGASVCRQTSLRVVEQLRIAVTSMSCVIDLSVTGAPFYSRITVTGTASGPEGVEFRPPSNATGIDGRGWSCGSWTRLDAFSCQRPQSGAAAITWSASFIVFRAGPDRSHPVEASLRWNVGSSALVSRDAFNKAVDTRITCP